MRGPVSLVTVNIEPTLLKRLITCLERIAAALERAYPDITISNVATPAPAENLFTFDPEKEWEKEQEEERQQGQEL